MQVAQSSLRSMKMYASSLFCVLDRERLPATAEKKETAE
jgi:hypothetical protein